jgi:hypothetical protein
VIHAELADEVAGLPGILQSFTPELLVDYLATIFKEGENALVSRLNVFASLEDYHGVSRAVSSTCHVHYNQCLPDIFKGD